MSFWLRMEGHPWPFSEGKQSTAVLPGVGQRASGWRQADWRRLVQTAGHRTPRSPGSELSRTGCLWSRGDSGTAGGGGTCRRSGTVAWRCHTPELQKTQGEKRAGKTGGAINGSKGISERRRSTGEFTGHKSPRLVPSASMCVLKAQQMHQGGRN